MLASTRIKRIEKRIESVAVKGPHDYATDPEGYARNILDFQPAPQQVEVANALREYPHRVLARSGHKFGKSAMMGWLINWFYDSFNPSLCISTAPTLDSVKDIVWAQVRTMRARASLGDLQPRAPEMSNAPDHVAKGMTASRGEAFHGRHAIRSFWLFDEAVAIDPVFWQVTRSMFKPEEGHMWLAAFNPTDTGSQVYWEEHATDDAGNPLWKTVQFDCLDHPNIIAQLNGQPPPIPAAVTLPMIDEWLYTYGCERIPAEEAGPTDLEWPPKSGKFYKQGPEFQARCRGLWPEGDMYAIWSELLVKQIETAILKRRNDELPQIGCDVARFGDDYTAFHVRWGDSSEYHQSVNGWSTTQSAERIVSLCEHWASQATLERPPQAMPIKPNQIIVKVDDDGVGGGVVDQLRKAGMRVIPISAGSLSISGRYPNKRSELWFQTMERARAGRMSIAKLDPAVKKRLRQQFMTILWAMNGMGLRVVEPKEHTKKRIGRSPDDADAANLAFMEGAEFEGAKYIEGSHAPRTPFEIPKDGRRPFGGR